MSSATAQHGAEGFSWLESHIYSILKEEQRLVGKLSQRGLGRRDDLGLDLA